MNKRFGRYLVFCLPLIVLLFAPIATQAQIQITLKNSFIEKYKDRVTIDSTYTVDKAHKTPNPASKDGDMHIAGRAPEIGLPVVAEIMNAKFEKKAVDTIHEIEGSGESIKITGVWRIWCEHGGDSQQVQGEALQPFDTTNPAHVFEIHPVTQIEDENVLDSFKPIIGFTYKDADDAFTHYESIRSHIIRNPDDTTTIETAMAGYNYVEFKIQLDSVPETVEDGTMVFASVLNKDGELLVQKRRMVFVKGSAPEKRMKALKKGATLHVLGIPRIDLALVSYRTHHADTPGILDWNLPYEVVIVAVFTK